MPPSARERIDHWNALADRVLRRARMEIVAVDVETLAGEGSEVDRDGVSFLPVDEERALGVSVALAALGSDLFGGRGQGADADADTLNLVKKRADETASYALGEGLFMASRSYTNDAALMISLGEGTMVKGGETEAMGSNPTLGFARTYCPPTTAVKLEPLIERLLNERGYGFADFHRDVSALGVALRSAAVDPLEGTSRFAKGKETGPMVVLHVYDRPMRIAEPFESYFGTLAIPEEVAETADRAGAPIGFATPRAEIVEAIQKTYPGTEPGDIAVWTLGGSKRAPRLEGLWNEWRDAGARLVEDGEAMPSGLGAFVDSGTYAPTFRVGQWRDAEGSHVFLVDGYAASAEAVQAATLATSLGVRFCMAPLTPKFARPIEVEREIFCLDPDAESFASELARVTGKAVDAAEVSECRDAIRTAREAGVPVGPPSLSADDFFPGGEWNGIACVGFIGDDPYSGAPGVQHEANEHRVTCELSGTAGRQRISLTLRSTCAEDELGKAFTCLVRRIARGEDVRQRAITTADAGRIRNDLLTLVPGALVHRGKHIRIRFEAIQPSVLSAEEQGVLFEQLSWLREQHPKWFGWLELEPGAGGSSS